jgi:hypothetical protein
MFNTREFGRRAGLAALFLWLVGNLIWARFALADAWYVWTTYVGGSPDWTCSTAFPQSPSMLAECDRRTGLLTTYYELTQSADRAIKGFAVRLLAVPVVVWAMFLLGRWIWRGGKVPVRQSGP